MPDSDDRFPMDAQRRSMDALRQRAYGPPAKLFLVDNNILLLTADAGQAEVYRMAIAAHRGCAVHEVSVVEYRRERSPLP